MDHVAPELWGRMRSLLTGEDPDAQVVLLAGFYGAELYQMGTAAGFEVVSCDYRWAEHNGMHFVGDIRDTLFTRYWLAVIAAPPHREVAWSGACPSDACWELLAVFTGSNAIAAVPWFGERRDAGAADVVDAGGTLQTGWQSSWALPPGGNDSSRQPGPVAIRASGRKRSTPVSYELRDENDKLPEDAGRTGPVLDWAWLPLPISPPASAPEWIAFTLPAQKQPLPSALPRRLRFSGRARGAREQAEPTRPSCLPVRATDCPGNTPYIA